MKSLVKNCAAPLLGMITIFNIYAQDADDLITPYEIEQGQYGGAGLKKSVVRMDQIPPCILSHSQHAVSVFWKFLRRSPWLK